jgi:hypothetical protein
VAQNFCIKIAFLRKGQDFFCSLNIFRLSFYVYFRSKSALPIFTYCCPFAFAQLSTCQSKHSFTILSLNVATVICACLYCSVSHVCMHDTAISSWPTCMKHWEILKGKMSSTYSRMCSDRWQVAGNDPWPQEWVVKRILQLLWRRHLVMLYWFSNILCYRHYTV